ncbi:MAG: hypothetical protein N4A61_03450 [Pelagimonas sp.]|jgi:hypothetical protein|nr:hypothetical protein [Pelagimonas sp.]
MKFLNLFLIVTAGLFVGYMTRNAFAPQPDRVTRILEIYTEFCIPNLTGSQPVDGESIGLSPVNWPERSWIDGDAQAFVRLNDRSCSINTMAPIALNKRDAKALAKRLEPIVHSTFPDLAFDPKSRLGSISVAWMDGEIRSPSRWGTYFFATPEHGKHAYSILSLSLPREPKP